MSPRTEEQNQKILDEKRELILNSALKIFGRRGFAGTKISDVAKEAKISHGLIYHYFSSKEELYASLVERAIEGSNEGVAALCSIPVGPWEKLQLLTENMLRIFSEDKLASFNFLIMTQAPLLDPMPECVRSALRIPLNTIEIVAELITEGQNEGNVIAGDPVTLAVAYWTFIQGIVLTGLTWEMPQFTNAIDKDIVLRILKA